MAELKKISVKIPEDTYTVIENMAKKNNSSVSETIRSLLNKSLNAEWFKENEDIMARLIRQQMEIVIKPHIERLAKLSSKSGHMSATAAFLNVQALMDLVPKENRKNVREMYENARKKAAEYMRTN
ncbi:MAG: ribbon-helix-helix protein, CopG family [Clostridiales bacterium]|nr:ribbon-helix-helix protein, CopG family [Clostridiales bacterium]